MCYLYAMRQYIRFISGASSVRNVFARGCCLCMVTRAVILLCEKNQCVAQKHGYSSSEAKGAEYAPFVDKCTSRRNTRLRCSGRSFYSVVRSRRIPEILSPASGVAIAACQLYLVGACSCGRELNNGLWVQPMSENGGKVLCWCLAGQVITYSEGLRMVPLCARPVHRHCSGHQHCWE